MDYNEKLVGEAITAHYETCLEKHKGSLLEVDWTNKEAAISRYWAFMRHVPDGIWDGMVLDFGCGTGRLCEYLRFPMRDRRLAYAGCDSSLNMVVEANKKFGDLHNFFHLPVGQELEWDYDYIVCNGTFTEKRDASWIEMMDYVKSTLSMLLKHTRSTLIVNFMNFHSLPIAKHREEMFFVKLNEVADLCEYLGVKKYTIDASYLPYEFIVRMDK